MSNTSDIRPGQVFTHHDGSGAATRSVWVAEIADGRAQCKVISDRDERMVNVVLTITTSRLSKNDWCRTA